MGKTSSPAPKGKRTVHTASAPVAETARTSGSSPAGSSFSAKNSSPARSSFSARDTSPAGSSFSARDASPAGSSFSAKGGSHQELESLRIEYQNLFDRSNKLDNKVYITVTFLGFMFVFITSLFGSIPQLDLEGTDTHTVLTILYMLTTLAVAITYVCNLIFFMRLLAPEGIIRLDPDKIAAGKLDTCTESEAEERLIVMYRNIINADLEKLHNRCDSFVRGLRLVLVTLILSFLSYGLQILVRVIP